jgi:hypothetical protein
MTRIIAAICLALSAASGDAGAAEHPVRLIRLVVGFGAAVPPTFEPGSLPRSSAPGSANA